MFAKKEAEKRGMAVSEYLSAILCERAGMPELEPMRDRREQDQYQLPMTA